MTKENKTWVEKFDEKFTYIDNYEWGCKGQLNINATATVIKRFISQTIKQELHKFAKSIIPDNYDTFSSVQEAKGTCSERKIIRRKIKDYLNNYENQI